MLKQIRNLGEANPNKRIVLPSERKKAEINCLREQNLHQMSHTIDKPDNGFNRS